MSPLASAQTRDEEPKATKPLFGVKAASFEETELENGHFAYAIPRGTSIDDAAEIISYTNKPLNVHVYAADMRSATGGALAPAQQSDKMDTVGNWLRLKDPEQAVVGVPAKGRVAVPFTVTVPEGTASGDYPGAIVVAADIGKNDRGLNVQTRVALMVRVTVPGKTNLAASVGRPIATVAEDGYRFDVKVENEGNVLFTMIADLEVRKGGERIATLPLVPMDIYVIPSGESTISAAWRDVPEFGRAKVVAHVRTFINGEHRKTFTSGPTTVTFMPWKKIGVLLAALGALAAAAVGFRRRIRRAFARRREDREILRRHRQELAHEVKTDDALVTTPPELGGTSCPYPG